MNFHHVGKPVPLEQIQHHPQVKYSPLFDMYSLDTKNELEIPIELHAFGKNSSLHPRIQKENHVAFTCTHIEEKLNGQKILLPLYEPFDGYRCAIILVDQQLIELIETTLTKEEIWSKDTLKDSKLYPQNFRQDVSTERFGALWILAISMFIFLTMTIGIKFSWLALTLAIVFQLLLLTAFPSILKKPEEP